MACGLKNRWLYLEGWRKQHFKPSRAEADGFVVYINCQEAGRYNMPNGNITFSSFSSSYAESTPLTGTLEISSSLFKSGNNVIAVEIHNNSYTSSDQYWAAELFTTMGSASEGFVSTDPVFELSSSDNAMSLVA